jgi:riboflavin biosynthesis pyrimidine reductase
MGANTLRTENPEMRGTNGTLSSDRIRAIISRSGFIPVTGKKLFDHGPKPVVFTGEDNISALQDRLKDKARVLSLPEGPHGLSLQAALDIFAGRGVESLLIEGGAQLNYLLSQASMATPLLPTVPNILAIPSWNSNCSPASRFQPENCFCVIG